MKLKKIFLLTAAFFSMAANADTCPSVGEIKIGYTDGAVKPYYYAYTDSGWHDTSNFGGLTPWFKNYTFKSATIISPQADPLVGEVKCNYAAITIIDREWLFSLHPVYTKIYTVPELAIWTKNQDEGYVCSKSQNECIFNVRVASELINPFSVR